MKKLSFLSTMMLFVIAAMLPQNVKAQVSVWDGTYAPWTNGTGTESDPFLIENAQQLAYLTYRVNNGLDAAGGHVSNHDFHYKLMTDVNLNGSQSFQWAPIGYWNSNTDYYSFGGHFDGNNHTVSGLYINSSANGVGFFGYTDGAVIKNLSVSGNGITTTGQCAGGIVGYANEATIKDCHNACSCMAAAVAGGIAGRNYVNRARGTTSISNCSNTGAISCTSSSKAGGVVGLNEIRGNNSTSNIINCYNTGAVAGTNASANENGIGGIVGNCTNSYSTTTVKNCFNRGNINGFRASGIIGSTTNNGTSCTFTITNCYNTGNVTGNGGVGGIVGYTCTVNNSYYLDNCGGANTYGGLPMSSAAMQTAEFVDILNNGSCSWEQDAIPYTNDGYPVLTMVIRNVSTLAATNITQTNSTLRGMVSVENDMIISAGFIYKANTASNYSSVHCSNITDTITYTLSGLPPAVRYTFKTFIVTAGCDTTFGNESTFTTLSVSATTNNATNITQTHATLNGSFTIGDANMSSYGFEYKKNTDTVFQIVAVSGEGSVSETITGLTPNTQYTYRTFCTAVGCEPIYGNYWNFTTQAVSVTTNSATDLTENSATLNGAMNMGDVTVTNQGFEYRAFGDANFATVSATGSTDNFSAPLYGLTVNTQYEYRAFVNIAESTEPYYGNIQTFEVSWLNADTILIYDADMLQWVSDRCNTGTTFEGKYIKLMNNIVLPLNQPNNMTSIGVYPNYPFKGTFDGNGMTITNLYIDQPNTPYQGFFGYTQNANLYQVGLVNITASGRNYTGGMVAYADNTYMRDCYVNGGSLFALSYCGGLVGYQSEGTNSIISGCYNTCTVSGTSYVGGLVGFSNYATVRNSYVAASVAAQGTAVGAIIGGANEVLMYNCYFSTSITGQSNAIGEHNFRDGEGLSNEEMQSTQFVATLNQGLVTPVWKSDYAVPINNGFPILIWQYSDAEACEAPENLSYIISGNSATLTWDGGDNASYFTIEYGMSGDDVHTENTSNHLLVIHDLQNGNYFWRVKSVCSFGESNFVNGSTIETGINNHYQNASLNVYPNPTTNIVNVELTINNGQSGDVAIQVYDMYGKLLDVVNVGNTDAMNRVPTDHSVDSYGVANTHGLSAQTTQIDLSRYTNGVYFIKAVSEGNVLAVRKVVKNR